MSRPSMPAVWGNFGLCFANDVHNGGTQTNIGFQADVDYLKSVGIRHVRMALRPFSSYNQSNYAIQQQAFLQELVQMLIAAGIQVQLCIEYGYVFDPADTTNLNGYTGYLATMSSWAQSVGVSRIQTCNEIEGLSGHVSGVTNDQIYTWLQTLPAVVKGAGFTGPVTYSTVLAYPGMPHMSAWVARGLGNFDDLGGDCYNTVDNVNSICRSFKAVFGDKGFLSEWNVTNSGTIWDFNQQDPKALEAWIMNLYTNVKLNFPNHVNYFFTWKNANDGPVDALACRTLTGRTRLFWYSLINQRSPIAR